MSDRRFPILHGAFDPACIGCGACCTARAKGPEPQVNVCIFSSKEFERWPDEVMAEVRRTDTGAMGFRTVRRGDFDVCVFLEGEIGVDAGCTLHAIKPTECRWFLPGSQGCRDDRRQHSLELDEDPDLMKKARRGDLGAAHLLEMRLHIGERPDSLDFPDGVGDIDHYRRERDRARALSAYHALEEELVAMRLEHGGKECPDEEDLLERMLEAWFRLDVSDQGDIKAEGPKTLIAD